jgi:homoserine kinase
VEVPDVSLRSRNAIPLERGMGSSAAAAVAGAALARAVTAAGGRDLDLIDRGRGARGSCRQRGRRGPRGVCVAVDGVVRRLEPSSALRPIVCIPHVRQSTNEARAFLPEHVTLAEAASNGARAAMVLAGLSGAVAFEPSAMVDVLHEPARLAAMTGSGRLVCDAAAGRRGGVPVRGRARPSSRSHRRVPPRSSSSYGRPRGRSSTSDPSPGTAPARR